MEPPYNEKVLWVLCLVSPLDTKAIYGSFFTGNNILILSVYETKRDALYDGERLSCTGDYNLAVGYMGFPGSQTEKNFDGVEISGNMRKIRTRCPVLDKPISVGKIYVGYTFDFKGSPSKLEPNVAINELGVRFERDAIIDFVKEKGTEFLPLKAEYTEQIGYYEVPFVNKGETAGEINTDIKPTIIGTVMVEGRFISSENSYLHFKRSFLDLLKEYGFEVDQLENIILHSKKLTEIPKEISKVFDLE